MRAPQDEIGGVSAAPGTKFIPLWFFTAIPD
jgi:hypothetical protein